MIVDCHDRRMYNKITKMLSANMYTWAQENLPTHAWHTCRVAYAEHLGFKISTVGPDEFCNYAYVAYQFETAEDYATFLLNMDNTMILIENGTELSNKIDNAINILWKTYRENARKNGDTMIDVFEFVGSHGFVLTSFIEGMQYIAKSEDALAEFLLKYC